MNRDRESFDLRAYLDELASQPIVVRQLPLVSRRVAAVLTAGGYVEGRDFEVYPGLDAVTRDEGLVP